MVCLKGKSGEPGPSLFDVLLQAFVVEVTYLFGVTFMQLSATYLEATGRDGNLLITYYGSPLGPSGMGRQGASLSPGAPTRGGWLQPGEGGSNQGRVAPTRGGWLQPGWLQPGEGGSNQGFGEAAEGKGVMDKVVVRWESWRLGLLSRLSAI